MNFKKVNYRERARSYVIAAKTCFKLGTDIKYGFLDLRMTIEALVYERLQFYQNEVSYDVMLKWTPKQILKELEYIDADEAKQISISIDMGKDGIENWASLGTSKKFSISWAKKNHNFLSSVLHEKTIKQFQKEDNEDHLKSKALNIISELNVILEAAIFKFSEPGDFCMFDCECGFKINRKTSFIENNTSVSCPQCSQIYKVQLLEENKFCYSVSKEFYKCKSCEAKQSFDTKLLAHQATVSCICCGAKSMIVSVYTLERFEDS